MGGRVSNGTETANINAGNSFTFSLDMGVYHIGRVSLYAMFWKVYYVSNYASPTQVYVKLLEAAKDYDGSGLWFKIFDWGTTLEQDSRAHRIRAGVC